MEEEQEGKKGFRVVDKRVVGREGDEPAKEARKVEREKVAPEEKASAKEAAEEREEVPPLPEVNFASFIYSLSTSVLINLGDIPDPTTQKMMKNLALAKQTIDILAILQEKTKGNTTEEESNLLNTLLYDLRMRYVKAAG